jgi:hypothetical protein
MARKRAVARSTQKLCFYFCGESVMRRVKPLLFAIMVLFLSSEVAAACSCVGVPSVAEGFAQSRVVFSGKVIARLEYGVRFKVERAWKGMSSDEVYIYTGKLRNSCDPWFEKGESWLVYAWNTQLYSDAKANAPIAVKLMAHGCHRTTPLENAAEDLKELGEGKAPVRKRKNIKRNVARSSRGEA